MDAYARTRGVEMGDRLDFSDVRGQTTDKRALEVAAAGGHHLLMIGPPGAGKSSLVDGLVNEYRGKGARVGVIALDLESGAVLCAHDADKGFMTASNMKLVSSAACTGQAAAQRPQAWQKAGSLTAPSSVMRIAP